MMSLNYKAEDRPERKLIPNGTYIARCNLVVDLGDQQLWQPPDSQDQIRYAPQVIIGWEVNELDYNVKNYLVTENYNVYTSEKAKLRITLESWLNVKETNLETLINKPAQVTTQINEKGNWSKVVAVTGLQKGVDAFELTTEPLVYNLGDRDVYDKLPQFIRNKIDESNTPHFDENDEKIPF